MNARNGQLRCGECDAVFNKQSSLNRHGHIHSGAFKCERGGCEKAFSSGTHLSKHLKRHSSTNIQVRIVPFNIRLKVEVKQEPSDEFDGESSQRSMKPLKRIKKEEEEDEVKVKIELKDKHDQTGDGDRDNRQEVGGCKKEEDDESYCGCDECDTELGRHKDQKSSPSTTKVSLVTSSPQPSSSTQHSNNIETHRDELFDEEQMDDDVHFEEGQFGLENNDGQMMQIEEEVGDGDEETEIEDNEVTDDEESQTVENAQIEATIPHLNEQSQVIVKQSARHFKRKQNENVDNQEDTEEEVTSQSNKRPRQSRASSTPETRFTTLALQCPLAGCSKMIDKDKFKKHVKEEHSIGPFRCAVKDCGQSFDKSHILGDHLAQSHQSTSQWNCHKCDQHFPSYKPLSSHNILKHQLGRFQCTFHSCTFIGEYRLKMYCHYKRQHKQTLKCLYSGCQFETPDSDRLTKHQRVHYGIKPYRCKWSQCDYASAEVSKVIRHIRGKHYKGKPSSSVRLRDYVAVNEMLLDNPDGHVDDANWNSGKQNTQIITHTLQCPQCGLMFVKHKFNKHLKEEHSISPFRCQVKDCKQSFDNS